MTDTHFVMLNLNKNYFKSYQFEIWFCKCSSVIWYLKVTPHLNSQIITTLQHILHNTFKQITLHLNGISFKHITLHFNLILRNWNKYLNKTGKESIFIYVKNCRKCNFKTLKIFFFFFFPFCSIVWEKSHKLEFICSIKKRKFFTETF